jgi:hypothetical protein
MKSNKIVLAIVALAAVIAMAVPALVSGASVRAQQGYGGGNEPTFDPTNFGSPVDNPYFPLEPGTRSILRGVKDGVTQTERSTVTSQTKQILGVTVTVVHDISLHHGQPLEETFDWYAADNDGNVWYMGEDTKEFDANGHVTSTEGSWEPGVDGAVPGVIMLADPQVDDAYRQEFYAGQAEDQAWVVRIGAAITVPYGTVNDVLRSLEWTRLEPNVVDLKVYAPGLGIVYERTLSGSKEIAALVSVSAV